MSSLRIGKKRKPTNTSNALPTLKFIDKNHNSIYNEMKKRKFRPSRHYHRGDMEKLGINDDLWFLFENLRMGSFVNSSFMTYLEPCLEFFSSFSVDTLDLDNDIYEIKFQLFNTPHTVTLEQFNQALDFHPEANIYRPLYENFRDYNETSWWRHISGRNEFITRKSIASELYHPALRILHRLLGYSVISKQDLGKLTKEEVCILWIASSRELPRRVNLGFLFMTTCLAIAQGKRSGDIHCGAMVTRLAIKLGHADMLPLCTPVGSSGDIYLDLDQLRRSDFALPTTNPTYYSWLVRGGHHCFLPKPHLTSINRNTDYVWRVLRDNGRVPDIEGEDEVQEELEERQQQQQDAPQPTGTFQLSDIARQLQVIYESQQGHQLQQQALYDSAVDRGEIAPPVNYPNWPPQHGPVPSWGGDNLPSYPYWQGPSELGRELRSFPEDGEYDYRVPGGCDFRGDPAYPYVHPDHPAPLYSQSEDTPSDPLPSWQEDLYRGHYGWPPGFDGGWGLFGPPSGFVYDVPPHRPSSPSEPGPSGH